MKVFLMFKDHDFDLQEKLPWNEQALTQDLELNTLFNAMALGDKFLFDVAQKAVLSGLNNDLETVLYRQDILRDCLKNSAIVRAIYDIAVESIEKEKKNYLSIFSRYPAAILYRSVEVLQMFVDMLKKLRTIADEHADKFESDGFTAFFAMLNKELSDEYFACIQNHLKELKFREGVLISAELGKGNKGINYILRKPQDKKQSWIERVFTKKAPVYTFYIADRDESGARALSELKDRGINLVANALAQSNDHILSFFNVLRTELAFYIGCLNLYERLTHIGEPTCFPLPVAPGERRHSFKGLYDVCLALTLEQKIVGNDVNADNKELVIITGANQGGKSTFLRSIGLAQLMMQCGMFVPAESFCANFCDSLFTHYKREEDVTMKSGKLDEELSRMSDIIDHITSNSMVLFNESFAATNEREGSEIARQIVSALLEKHIKVFFVTHLYEFAHGFFDKKMATALFLRAERQADGTRTFKLIEGEPLQTSYGEDLYNSIFGKDN
ncbi:DNA mismatch repair protein MutS [Neomoorella glycerini]|uniref:DNA mismatch repair protein MutS n=1 Tax=Neomoorella glycerini TaxID=55779 RepID=A0A6I5ZUS0_9FIRM|nr:DNA mismatch repair protein MutS [Moorella glycerini]QGP93802.1 DNA mismatch repair protein MutS [Moorella glycerini]